MSDPRVGDEDLFLITHYEQFFEGARNGGPRAIRGEGKEIA